MTRIGELRHRVHIQSRSTGRDSRSGEPVDTWSTDKTVWAKKEHVGGREMDADDNTRSELRARFTIRHTDGVNPAKRLVEAETTSLVWNVEAVRDETGRRRFLTVDANQFDST